jgi:ElaB/YqjD/DUF883 family membrane-anchored ribosome-binding protein
MKKIYINKDWQNTKEINEISDSDIQKLNEELDKTLETIIDKTENENKALKKIIKAYYEAK